MDTSSLRVALENENVEEAETRLEEIGRSKTLREYLS